MGNDGQTARLLHARLCPSDRYPSDGDADPSTGLGAGWQCLEERDGSGDLVARYTYAPGYIDDAAVQERDLNADDDFADANDVVYYHRNTLFSVYALTDGSEDVVERYRYDAYGGCTVLDADGSADSDGISDVANAYAFTGRRLDPESGLMQYRHRYYSPTLGRAAQRDPIGYPNGWNLYHFLSGNPLFYPDPSGLMTFTANEDGTVNLEGTILCHRVFAGAEIDILPGAHMTYKGTFTAKCNGTEGTLSSPEVTEINRKWTPDDSYTNPGYRYYVTPSHVVKVDICCPEGTTGTVWEVIITMDAYKHEWFKVSVPPLVRLPVVSKTTLVGKDQGTFSMACCVPIEAVQG